MMWFMMLLTCCSYLLLAKQFWHDNTRPDFLQQIWLSATLCGHASIAISLSHGISGFSFGFGPALSLLALLTALFYWIENWFLRINPLLALTLLLATIATPLPLLFPGNTLLNYTNDIMFQLHFMVAMLAYGMVTLCAFHAGILLFVTYQLQHHTHIDRIQYFPPLLTLDNILFRLVILSFVLLSITLGSGIVFSNEIFGTPLPWSHKTLFSVLAWLMFAGLLLGKITRGWRGKTAARWVLGGFIALLLSYVGVNFVRQILLPQHDKYKPTAVSIFTGSHTV